MRDSDISLRLRGDDAPINCRTFRPIHEAIPRSIIQKATCPSFVAKPFSNRATCFSPWAKTKTRTIRFVRQFFPKFCLDVSRFHSEKDISHKKYNSKVSHWASGGSTTMIV
jgi:hypothetical protein